MQLKPRPATLAPSYFKLTSQLVLTAVHDDIEDAVMHSVSRREKITLLIRFSENNPEIATKRTSYSGKVIDLRTSSLASKVTDKNAIDPTVRRNVIRTLNLIGQVLDEDEKLFKPDILVELKLTFSMGKASGITLSKSKEFMNRHG